MMEVFTFLSIIIEHMYTGITGNGMTVTMK